MSLLPSDQLAPLRPWLDQLQRGLILFSRSGNCTYANARARHWLGTRVAEATLHQITSLLLDSGFHPDIEGRNRWQRGPQTLEVQVDASGAEGSVVWLDEIQPAVARRMKFYAVASHDIRGALANIRSFASLLLHPRWKLDTKVRHGLEVMSRNADRAMNLATEVFDSLRSELLPLDVDVQEQPLKPLVETAVERAQRAASEREVDVEVDWQGPLASWPTDATRLSHALDALLEHAVCRTPSHGTCHFRVRASEDRVIMAVSGGGPSSGDPQAVEGLFERDRQVERTGKLDASFRLSLARAEAEALGGSLEAAPTADGVLCVTLTLPRPEANPSF